MAIDPRSQSIDTSFQAVRQTHACLRQRCSIGLASLNGVSMCGIRSLESLGLWIGQDGSRINDAFFANSTTSLRICQVSGRACIFLPP